MRALLPLLRTPAISLAATAVALVLTLLLWPLNQRFPFALFIAGVLVSVWKGGPHGRRPRGRHHLPLLRHHGAP